MDAPSEGRAAAAQPGAYELHYCDRVPQNIGALTRFNNARCGVSLHGGKDRARLQHIKVLDYACITEMLSWYSPQQMEADRALACPQPGGGNVVLKSSSHCFITEMSQKLKRPFYFEDPAAITAPEILKVRVTRELFYSFLIIRYLHAEGGQLVFSKFYSCANNQLSLSTPTLWIKGPILKILSVPQYEESVSSY